MQIENGGRILKTVPEIMLGLHRLVCLLRGSQGRAMIRS